VLVNAELDSLVGPLLKARADSAGVVVTHTDGDEPGVATTVLRYLRLLGLCPVAAGNIKGMGDHTSFADSAKQSMETTVLANATGFHVGRPGMYGPSCSYVKQLAKLLPAEQLLKTGMVNYSLRAMPMTGA
jgi:predicted homoserine dehydrogenase-like protein